MRKLASILLLAIAASAMLLAATAQAKQTAAVKVTAGKPTEFGFTLSPKSVKVGSVTFSVTNSGVVPHDFKVCTAPSTTDTANTCKGKGTKMISPQGTSTLTITFAKAGKYEYLCTVAGHASFGMKGLLTVK